MYKNIKLTHNIVGEIMKIEHIMSKNLIIADINSNIIDIAKTMQENDIGIIPISQNNKIIGVLTDSDIVTKIISNNDNKIKNYIIKTIITIDINQKLEEAINLIGNNKIKRLLVTNNKKLVGILSISDIIHNIDEHLLVENLKKIWEIYRNTSDNELKVNYFYL